MSHVLVKAKVIADQTGASVTVPVIGAAPLYARMPPAFTDTSCVRPTVLAYCSVALVTLMPLVPLMLPSPVTARTPPPTVVAPV